MMFWVKLGGGLVSTAVLFSVGSSVRLRLSSDTFVMINSGGIMMGSKLTELAFRISLRKTLEILETEVFVMTFPSVS